MRFRNIRTFYDFKVCAFGKTVQGGHCGVTNDWQVFQRMPSSDRSTQYPDTQKTWETTKLVEDLAKKNHNNAVQTLKQLA